MFEEGKLYISNLPNTTPRQEILEYLETAGPIKTSHFDQSGQRLSATIVYHDIESAQTAKKYLDQKQFNTRKIKITLERNRDPNIVEQNWLNTKILGLKPYEKKKLMQYLKSIRNQQGQMFQQFLEANPALVEDLMRV